MGITRLFVLLAALLSGCAVNQGAQQAAADANAPVLCYNADHCSRTWQAAQVWVAKNSAYKMRVVTDSIIQTEGPIGYDPGLAFQVTKEPAREGAYEIAVAASCANLFGCQPGRYVGIAVLKNYLRTINP